MLKKTRAEIIEDFRNQVKQGKILVLELGQVLPPNAVKKLMLIC